jgi:hypothetical protein
MARFKGGGMEKSLAKRLMKSINREVAKGIQGSAISIMNGLVEAGPAWSGKFSASWRFIPEGGDPGGPGQDGEIYTYSKKNARVTTIEKYMKAGITKFQIVNTAPYANLAIDAEIGTFVRPDDSWPLKKPTLGDERDNPSLRFEIGSDIGARLEEAPAARTAEADWYYTYLSGGKFQQDLSKGFAFEFGRGYSATVPPSF